MFSNTKLLAMTSSLILILGFTFLWFGFTPTEHPLPSSTPESTTTSTLSSEHPISTTSAPIKSGSAVVGIEGEQAVVSKVVDGDTIQLQSGQTVRFVGIDTPETVDPRRPVGCFGKEASNEVKDLLTGKTVVLEKDVSNTDKYNRLLRYIYLPLDNSQTLFVNDYLVREGFARVYTYPPDVKFNQQFIEAERQARELKKGLWGRC